MDFTGDASRKTSGFRMSRVDIVSIYAVPRISILKVLKALAFENRAPRTISLHILAQKSMHKILN